MKSLMQILGLKCRHRNRGVPLNGQRCCLDCGQREAFNSYELTEADKASVDHYQLHDRSLTRVSKPVLRWRRRR